jgi:hypothetical protein
MASSCSTCLLQSRQRSSGFSEKAGQAQDTSPGKQCWAK